MKVIIIGSTGLIGSGIVDALVSVPDTEVTALVRSTNTSLPSEINQIEVDFETVDYAQYVQDCTVAISALGTSWKKFNRAVDVGYNVAFGQACSDAGVKYFHFVSAVSAHKFHPIEGGRAKIEIEEALKGMGFDCLVVYKVGAVSKDEQGGVECMKKIGGGAAFGKTSLGKAIVGTIQQVNTGEREGNYWEMTGSMLYTVLNKAEA